MRYLTITSWWCEVVRLMDKEGLGRGRVKSREWETYFCRGWSPKETVEDVKRYGFKG